MKRYDRRTFLKLSGASAVMLALAGCEDECFGGSGAPDIPDSGSSIAPSTYDPFYSEEITTLGPPLPEAPDSPPIPVIRDGRKIFEIINAELTRRKVQYFKLQYNAGLEHSIQSEMQMFVDYDTPSFSAEEGLEARMNGDYVDGMWAGFEEGAAAPPPLSGASTTTAMASSWTITKRNATIWTGPTRPIKPSSRP